MLNYIYEGLVQCRNQTYLVETLNRTNARKDGWIDDLRLYVLLNSISVITGRWEVENEKLCAMEPRFRLKIFSSQARIEPGTTRS